MLDKLSEKVLQYAISRHKDYFENISFNEDDAEALGIGFARLRAALEYLQKKECLTIVCSYYGNSIHIKLTHKGFSYFEYKCDEQKEQRFNHFHQWMNTIIALLALLISVLKQ